MTNVTCGRKKLQVSGKGADGALSSVELYDWTSGEWAVIGDLDDARQEHTSTRMGGLKVLVSGGYNEAAKHLDTVEIFDESTNTWTGAASLNIKRRSHTATLLPDGRVMVAGGGILIFSSPAICLRQHSWMIGAATARQTPVSASPWA